MVVDAVADLGFNAWLLREFGRTGDPLLYQRGLGVRLAMAGAAAVAWALASAGGLAAGIVPAYVPLLSVWIFFDLVWATLTTPLRARQEMRAVALAAAVERATLLAFVFLGRDHFGGDIGLVAGLAAGAVLSAALVALRLPDELRRFSRPAVCDVCGALRESVGFTVSSLALQAQKFDVALVSLVAGSSAAGIYAAPARLANALVILPTAFAAAVFPRAVNSAGRQLRRELTIGLTCLLGLMIVIEAPIIWFARPLATLFLGSSYRESGAVLQLILVGTLLATVNQPVAVALQARGMEWIVARAVGIGSVVGLGFVVAGAAAFGATGAGTGFIALQIAIIVGIAVMTRQHRHGSGQPSANTYRRPAPACDG